MTSMTWSGGAPVRRSTTSSAADRVRERGLGFPTRATVLMRGPGGDRSVLCAQLSLSFRSVLTGIGSAWHPRRVTRALEPDREPLWPDRRHDAFDGLCCRAAPRRVPGCSDRP